jgi:hypothetical protein
MGRCPVEILSLIVFILVYRVTPILLPSLSAHSPHETSLRVPPSQFTTLPPPESHPPLGAECVAYYGAGRPRGQDLERVCGHP